MQKRITAQDINRACLDDAYLVSLAGMCGYARATCEMLGSGLWYARAREPISGTYPAPEYVFVGMSRASRWNAIHQLVRIMAATDFREDSPGYIPYYDNVGDPAPERLRDK